MPTRRAVMVSALASAAIPPGGAQAADDPQAAAPTVLRLIWRTLEVNGKPALVYGIRQPDGTAGITTRVGDRFIHLPPAVSSVRTGLPRTFRCTMRIDCGQLDPAAVIRPEPGECIRTCRNISTRRSVPCRLAGR